MPVAKSRLLRSNNLYLLIGIFSLFLGLPCVGTSQSSAIRIQGKSLLELKQEGHQPLVAPLIYTKPLFFSSTSLPQQQSLSPVLTTTTPNFRKAPNIYSYQDLAFFCRLEVKMEKASKMPVKFRLGEVQYVERMEGKQ